MDETLLLMADDPTRDGDDIRAVAMSPLRELADDNDPSTSFMDLLIAAPVREQWSRAADSYLAVTFASAALPETVVAISRMLIIWALLERLGRRRSLSHGEVEELQLDAVVVIPGDVHLIGAVNGVVKPLDVEPEPQQPRSKALDRHRQLTGAIEDIRSALRQGSDTTVLPQTDTEPAEQAPAQPAISGVLFESLAPTLLDSTRQVLAEHTRDAGPVPLLTVLSGLETAADQALSEHTAALELAHRDAYKRQAVAAELVRKQPWLAETQATLPGNGRVPVVVDADLPQRVGDARLLSPPVLGALKVVRQTLAGYELGEIAHVENVLDGENKIRRHRVVDVTETESTESDSLEQKHQHDLQTTTKSELATEVQETVANAGSFNAGGTITASYGPYFSASATVGVSQSKSQSTTTKASTKFAKDVIDRTTDSLRTRTERVRRSLTRRTITEENTHTLAAEGGNTVGVYRWVNKLYCAQVYNYGLRVLLDIGIPDPAVDYRFATELGADLDVDADPPPALVYPGTKDPLIPGALSRANWQTMAATFRVAGFPPPPLDFVTTPLAWSEEAPQAPPAQKDEAPPPAPRLFKTSREVTIPGGYLPTRFAAAVLSDGPSGRYGNNLTSAEREILRATQASNVDRAPAEVRGRLWFLLNMWLTWDPFQTPIPALSLDDIRLLNDYIVPDFANTGAMGEGLRTFVASASGGLRPGIELAVGTTMVWAPPGAHKVRERFSNGQKPGEIYPELTITETEGTMLPIAVSTTGGQGFALAIEIVSQMGDLVQRWQYEAYAAILAAHTAWENDWRSAVAAAETQRGVAISGRNSQENAEIIRTELKRSVISMLGAPAVSDLDVVTPGSAVLSGTPPKATPPQVDRQRAGQAARLVAFYEQAFEWQNTSYIFYPYFWTGRRDWPEALARTDPDPLFTQFLRAGSARVVLPVRPGFESVVASRLHLTLPSPAVPASAPQPSDGPYLDIAEEIRAAQDVTAGGVPSGPPWPVVLPTTLVALDSTPMPSYETACSPPEEPDDDA
ncbi:hypothetical protein OHB35_53065 [Streptomyces phaeochromogenes]|uniref:Uncharacterized protein n=1 Tax=Streptomyces phaeochromogenes TaxID=1923 RepID=A0ABZ1HUL4_STRPH|nr:hypothetical protein [Streptomyces phaeochromogenes]WSD21272.1 hypothetical protein OHB35_53065 [Streptomyces phaeochromogenes]